MTDLICVHGYVSGKVQGVWFRASTKTQADQLNITGWVRNLPDERVEVLLCGTKDDIAAMLAWLKQGPPLAKVNDVHCEDLPHQIHVDFKIL